MKNRSIFYTFIFFLVTLHSFSQVNDYFLNSPKWEVRSQYYSGSGCWGSLDEYNYTIAGDTTINFLTYKKIQRSGIVTYLGGACEPLSTSSYVDANYSAYLRSNGKQMYYRGPVAGPADSTGEILLYDFDLIVGDTIPESINSVYNGTPVITVTAIDSFYTSSGYRKRFQTSSSVYLYEGIGTSGGLLEEMHGMFLSGTNSLVCFSLNDSSYVPSTGLSCDVFTGLLEKTTETSVLAFPNPFSDKTLISTTIFLKDAVLHLYDSRGSLVKAQPFFGTSVSIDRGELNSGIYCYRIIAADRPMQISGKLVITDK